MKEKHKVFTVLEVEDVERLVSEMAGRDIKVGDMEVTLIDGVPLGPVMDGDIGSLYMTCEVRVDGEEIYDDDYNSPLDEYMPDYAYTPEEYMPSVMICEYAYKQ